MIFKSFDYICEDKNIFYEFFLTKNYIFTINEDESREIVFRSSKKILDFVITTIFKEDELINQNLKIPKGKFVIKVYFDDRTSKRIIIF